MDNKPYTPIACHVYDALEVAAMRRRQVTLTIASETGDATITDIILDLWARDGVEYIKLGDGSVFRLDDLRAVDGQRLQDEHGTPISCKLS